MMAFIAVKYHEDHCNRPLVEAITAALEHHGVPSRCIARDIEQWGACRFTPQVLMQHTFQAIDASTLIVIDLTEKGVGLGIEAGYAYARQKPIVVTARAGSAVSTTLTGIARHIFLYTHPGDLVGYFKQIIAQQEQP